MVFPNDPKCEIAAFLCLRGAWCVAAWDWRYWEVADPSLLSEGVLVCVIPTDSEYAQLRCSLRSCMLICRAFSECSFPFLIGGASIASVVNLLHFLAGLYKRRASPLLQGLITVQVQVTRTGLFSGVF